jgi:hypothetical protein
MHFLLIVFLSMFQKKTFVNIGGQGEKVPCLTGKDLFSIARIA